MHADATIPLAAAPSAAPLDVPTKRGLFFGLNALMAAVVLVSYLLGDDAELGTALYITALFALCTLPLCFLSSFRSKELLLLLLLAIYFIMFCLKDLANLVLQLPATPYPRDLLLTAGEIAIVVGAVCLLTGRWFATLLIPAHTPGILTRDWSPRITTLLGIAFWAVGFYFTASHQFGIADLHARTSSDPRIAGFFTMFRMLQPLGTLILIYQYLTTKRKLILIMLLATIAADIGLGFLGDTKEVAVRGPILYLVCLICLRERVPVVQTLVFVMLAGLLFHVFSQYRDLLHSRAMTREKALENIDSTLDRLERRNADVGASFTQGIDYLTDRFSLKAMVELTLARTGHGVEFQHGRTIKPLLYAFVPRFILPDKENNAMTGLLFNHEFHISESRQTYIAIGPLGELYWNFGWPGLVIGMIMIGAFMTWFSSLVALDTCTTLPRFLLLLCTIYLVALRFEDSIALTYTVWARVGVMLLLFHLLVPKKPA